MKRLIVLPLLIGCVRLHAQMVVPPGTTTENAPINEASRSGIVRYRNEGNGTLREKRRRDAYQKMSEACGGKYLIVNEGDAYRGDRIVNSGVTSKTLQDWYIQFRCVP